MSEDMTEGTIEEPNGADESSQQEGDVENVEASVLASTKKMLNIPPEVTAFDLDVMTLINGAFAILNQVGVGSEEAFLITDSSSTWDEFYTESSLSLIKPFVWMEVRLAFDPPTASVLSAMKEKRDEYLWRLNVAADRPVSSIRDAEGEDDQNDGD